MNVDLLFGVLLTLAVIAVLGLWFRWCGRADQARSVRAFAKRTLLYAGAGFVVGIAFLNSDLGTSAPQGRLGLVAFTVCCFLLIYAAAWAVTASDDDSLVIVNLTGRPLLLADPDLAPFYTLPAPQERPAEALPSPRPRTLYVVTPELAKATSNSGRCDVLVVDRATATDYGAGAPLLVRRLIRTGAGTA